MSKTETETQQLHETGEGENERSRIKAEKTALQARAKRAGLFKNIVLGIFVAAILAPFLEVFIFRLDPITVALPTFGIGIYLAAALYGSLLGMLSRPYEEEIAELNQQLELLEDTTEERRAERLFKLHQLDLKQYYSQTLRQAHSIFIAGLCCLVLGVIIVIGVLALIYGAQSTDLGHQILLASTGVVSGILTNFVGAIF
jgi:hypothetical protein